MSALLNGAAPDAAALLHSRALHYGDGVFRTALVHGGQVHELARHLDKLDADAARLGLRMPERALLADEAARLAGPQGHAVLKMLLWRRSAGRGYRPATDACDRLLLVQAPPSHPPQAWQAGVRLFRSPHVLPEQPELAGVKHLNRLDQVLAGRGWPDDGDEGILCDRSARPIGGTRTNLFWVSDGTLCTPALDRCGIDGITRNKIIELAGELQVKTWIAPHPWEALRGAAEAFVTNALIGLWPVRALDGARLPAPGPVTRALLAALRHPVP